LQVFFDTQPPDLQINNLTDGQGVEQADYTMRGNANDANGVVLVEYRVNSDDDSDWTAANGTTTSWEVAVSGLAEGSAQSFEVRAVDRAGNTRTLDAISFGLDLHPPVLEITNGDTYRDSYQRQDFVLTGSTGDANGV